MIPYSYKLRIATLRSRNPTYIRTPHFCATCSFPLPCSIDVSFSVQAQKSTSIDKSLYANDPDGNRTRVTAVKGRCLNRLTTGPRQHKLRYSYFSLRLRLHSKYLTLRYVSFSPQIFDLRGPLMNNHKGILYIRKILPLLDSNQRHFG